MSHQPEHDATRAVTLPPLKAVQLLLRVAPVATAGDDHDVVGACAESEQGLPPSPPRDVVSSVHPGEPVDGGGGGGGGGGDDDGDDDDDGDASGSDGNASGGDEDASGGDDDDDDDDDEDDLYPVSGVDMRDGLPGFDASGLEARQAAQAARRTGDAQKYLAVIGAHRLRIVAGTDGNRGHAEIVDVSTTPPRVVVARLDARNVVATGVLVHPNSLFVVYFQVLDPETGEHRPIKFVVNQDIYALVPEDIRERMLADGTREATAKAERDKKADRDFVVHDATAVKSKRRKVKSKSKARATSDDDDDDDDDDDGQRRPGEDDKYYAARIAEDANAYLDDRVVIAARKIVNAFFMRMCVVASLTPIGSFVEVPNAPSDLGDTAMAVDLSILDRRRAVVLNGYILFPQQYGFYVGPTSSPLALKEYFCAMVLYADINFLVQPAATVARRAGIATRKSTAVAAAAAAAATAVVARDDVAFGAGAGDAGGGGGDEDDPAAGGIASLMTTMLRQSQSAPAAARVQPRVVPVGGGGGGDCDDDDDDEGESTGLSADSILYLVPRESVLAARSANPGAEDRILSLRVFSSELCARLIGLLYKCTVVISNKPLALIERALVHSSTVGSTAAGSLPLANASVDTIAAAVAIGTHNRAAVGLAPVFPLAKDDRSLSRTQNALVQAALEFAKLIAPSCADTFNVSTDTIVHVSGATCKAAAAKRKADNKAPTLTTVDDLWINSEEVWHGAHGHGGGGGGGDDDDDGSDDADSSSDFVPSPPRPSSSSNGRRKRVTTVADPSIGGTTVGATTGVAPAPAGASKFEHASASVSVSDDDDDDDEDSLEFTDYDSTTDSSDSSCAERKLAQKLLALQKKRAARGEKRAARGEKRAESGGESTATKETKKRARVTDVADDSDDANVPNEAVAPPVKRHKPLPSSSEPVDEPVDDDDAAAAAAKLQSKTIDDLFGVL